MGELRQSQKKEDAMGVEEIILILVVKFTICNL